MYNCTLVSLIPRVNKCFCMAAGCIAHCPPGCWMNRGAFTRQLGKQAPVVSLIQPTAGSVALALFSSILVSFLTFALHRRVFYINLVLLLAQSSRTGSQNLGDTSVMVPLRYMLLCLYVYGLQEYDHLNNSCSLYFLFCSVV